jgi:glucose-6-phosphate 1-epimerase
MSQTAELNQRFSLPGVASVTEASGGLATVSITSPQCSGEVYLLGGQVTRWKPTGSEEVLWLSGSSLYQVGKAIRGGVPVCFPWFGGKADDPKAPSHGLVRNREWQLESIAGEASNVIVTLVTRSDDSTKPFWPADFELRLRASFGPQLRLQLQCTNSGSEAARFEEALHAYFTIGDVRQAGVTGLDGTDYIDKTDGNQRKSQAGAVKISSETDRVYLDTAAALEIHDPVMKRRIRIEKENSRNSVVWNPWTEKSRSLSDFGDDEWTGMICVEPSNVAGNSIEIAPGQQHTMGVTISVVR